MEEGSGDSMRRGLVVGKFSPLHKGHEYLIETALKHCDHLLILSYSNPEFKGCETETRRKWLDALYGNFKNVTIEVVPPSHMPLNTASDVEHQEYLGEFLFGYGYVPDILFCSEGWGKECARVLSYRLSSAYNRSHNVIAYIVDSDRKAVPISATQIRANPWEHAAYLSNHVLASFVKRVAFLGGESTGKTTLAVSLQSYVTGLYVAEYGRDLYVKCEGKLSLFDLMSIAREQVRREEAQALYVASRGCKYLLCDTTPLTTYGYSLWMFEHPNTIDSLRRNVLRQLAERKYDAVILCDADVKFVQDGTRVSEAFRDRQQAWYLEQTASMDCPVLKVTGSLEKRILDSIDFIRQL